MAACRFSCRHLLRASGAGRFIRCRGKLPALRNSDSDDVNFEDSAQASALAWLACVSAKIGMGVAGSRQSDHCFHDASERVLTEEHDKSMVLRHRHASMEYPPPDIMWMPYKVVFGCDGPPVGC